MGSVTRLYLTVTMRTFMLTTLFFSNIFLTFTFSSAESTETTWPWTTPTRVPCINHECMMDEDGYFSEGDCMDTFCQCSGGQGFLQTCQEGTFYDPVEEVCNWPWNIPSCGSTTAPDPSCSYQCGEENGLFPEGCCEPVYCQCFHGEGSLQHCPSGSVFNNEEGFCDDPSTLDCCAF